jgi:hypothetical protein
MLNSLHIPFMTSNCLFGHICIQTHEPLALNAFMYLYLDWKLDICFDVYNLVILLGFVNVLQYILAYSNLCILKLRHCPIGTYSTS